MAFGPIISWQIEGEKVEKLADFIFRGSKITGGPSLIAQLVKNPPAMWETWVDPWVGNIPLRRERPPTPVFWLGEFHGLYSPWSSKESDMTERLLLSHLLEASWYLHTLPKWKQEGLIIRSFLCFTPGGSVCL